MRRALLLAAGVGLGACQSSPKAEYHYFPPASDAGGACVVGCYAQADDCVEHAVGAAEAATDSEVTTVTEEEAQRAHARCMEQADAEYRQCQRGRSFQGVDWNACYRPVCVIPGEGSALTPQSTARFVEAEAACNVVFRDCFRGCGGRIEVR